MIDVVLCRVSTHRVAVPLEAVREATWIAAATPLPGAPPWLLGLLDLRGALVPVVDVDGRLQRAVREPDLGEMLVICGVSGGGRADPGGRRTLAVLVRHVIGVAALADADGPRSEAEPWVSRVLRDGEGPVLLLDLDAIGAQVATAGAA